MWWVLTSQKSMPLHDSLRVVATTNAWDHLWMCWHYYKPARVPVYRTIRGIKKLCGYKYTWYRPHITRQIEPGDTKTHSWQLSDLIPGTTVWFYLYAPGGPYGLQIQGPLTSAKLPILAPWVTHCYVATRHKGVFYTKNFVLLKPYTAGVPSWKPINDGIDPAAECRGFKGDPYDPTGSQYFLNPTALYRRTIHEWFPILSRSDIIDYVGCTDHPGSRFPHNALDVNTNQYGWVAVTFVGRHDWNGVYTYRHYFCFSTDHGYTWTITVAEDGTLAARYPACLTVGVHKGTSPYQPGRVIYSMIRKGWQAYCLRSLDGGATWETFLIGLAKSRDEFFTYEGRMMVDPIDQNICYFTGALNPAGEYIIRYTQDHAETWPIYDGAALEPLGGRLSFFVISGTLTGIIRIDTGEGRLYFSKTTNGGASWSYTTAPYPSEHLSLHTVPGAPTSLYIVGTWIDAHIHPHSVWASADEGATMIPKSGANAHVADTGGGDSIPYNCGGIRGILPILTP